MEHKQGKKSNFTMLLMMSMAFIVVTAIVGILVFRLYVGNFKPAMDTKTYSGYYVMIVDDRKDSFWQAVYQGAYEAGQEENIYVELLGENLSREYEKTDLMRIAIASEVDGIIVVADESDSMTELIDTATEEGIPVVTLYSDNTKSKRCSYVGIGSYNLGREYGRQVLKIEEDRRKRSETAENAEDAEQTAAKKGIWPVLLFVRQ